jgi:hypothetical protein
LKEQQKEPVENPTSSFSDIVKKGTTNYLNIQYRETILIMAWLYYISNINI